MPNNQPGTPPPGGWPRPPNVPPDATVDAYGNWFTSAGDFVGTSNATSPTPAQNAAVMGPPQTEASTGKLYRIIDGQKWYIPPSDGAGYNGAGGGGLIHGSQQWNPQTGKYDTPIDWGKVLSMVAAGIITVGVADAALSGTPALAATAPTGTTTSAGALPAGVTLEGTAAGGGGASTAVGAGTTASSGLAGATSGLGTSALPGAGTALGGAGTAATDTGFVGPIAANGSGAAAGAAGIGGLSYGDILKGVAGPVGGVVNGLIQANAQGNATAAQQAYLQQALDYQKANDLYNRGIAANKVQLEAARYGDYSSRIQPWIDNGTTSNDRMAALLGLPARPGSTSGGGSSSGPGSSGVPVSADITAADLANYKSLGFSPTGRGSGPTDSAYYDEEIAATGGLTPANTAYWFGPNGRIAQDAAKAGVRPTAPAATPPPATPPATTPNPVTTQPQATAPEPQVMMRGPDGSTKSIPQSQVQHYTQLGATPLQGAA